MKKSNIIIIIAVILPLTWLLLSGWLQANAYKIIKSKKVCSYAEVVGPEIGNALPVFKNIKVDFEKNTSAPSVKIKNGEKQEISCANGLKKYISYYVNKDTLYLNIKHFIFRGDNHLTVSVPALNSVTLLSSATQRVGSFSNLNGTAISGFTANTLSVINDCQFDLRLENNRLRKLILKGQFYNSGKAEITNDRKYDSLDVDIQGREGTLILGSNVGSEKVNPKQWISIKVPGTFHIEADADVIMRSKIILKK